MKPALGSSSIGAALLCLSCTFQTQAIDPMLSKLGPEVSCGYYAEDTHVTSDSAACWEDSNKDGACFESAEGACDVPEIANAWPPGTTLTLWCPIAGHGPEEHRLMPCQ